MLHRYHTSRRWPIPELLRLPRTAGPDSSDPSAVRHLVRPRSKAASVTPVFVKSSCDLLLFNQELPHFIDSASPVSSCHICVQLAFRVAASISVPRMYQHVNLCRPPALVVCTAHPTGDWTVQQARKLALTLGERFEGIRFLIHGRGSNFTASFDAVFQAAGTRIVGTAVQAPRMNAICERLIGNPVPGVPGPRADHGGGPSACRPGRVPGALQHGPAASGHRPARPRRQARRRSSHNCRPRQRTDCGCPKLVSPGRMRPLTAGCWPPGLPGRGMIFGLWG